MTPYRETAEAPVVTRWTGGWSRLAVRLKRLLFWTVAAARHEWRSHCRRMEYLDSLPVGESKVTIRATGGSVVKNVYVNHGQLNWLDSLNLVLYRRDGHGRMPRA